jgi:hypothetical protein
VLRVTWHEGTLVLSLWRGEMCTASFRMPMDDVDRLLDALEDGFAEAEEQYPEGAEHHEAAPHDDAGYGDYPATGQYVRPPRPDRAEAEAGQVPSVGPNDVLVARGTPPAAQDRLVASGATEAVPRENLIVGDSLPYGHQPPPAAPPQYDPQPQRPRPEAPEPVAAQGRVPIDTDPYIPAFDEDSGGYEMGGPPPQAAPAAEPVDWYGTQQRAVDPHDPLGLGPVTPPQGHQALPGGEVYPAEPAYQQPAPDPTYPRDPGYPPAQTYGYQDGYQDSYPDGYQQPGQAPAHPYQGDPMYTTGERLRPEHRQEAPAGRRRRSGAPDAPRDPSYDPAYEQGQTRDYREARDTW